MITNKEQLKRKIAVAAKREKADIVIKGGKIIDVFNQEIIEGDIAIADGMFVGIGDFEGEQIIDAKNRYISPGFIDGHVHIESAMVAPSEFAKVVVPHGVTTVIADPHEIANVAGLEGIQFMIGASEHLPLNVYFMLPSCVPATPFENSGAILNSKDLQALYAHDRVLGLGEVMDYPAVFQAADSIVDKLVSAADHGKKIDGHAAGIDASGINVYMTAGIRSDHECATASEARERLQRGMYLMLREGSAAKDLSSLIEVVNEKNARRCLFVTDDKHLDDLLAEGSIDHNVRLAINYGISPLLAIQMSTLNAAECFGLSQKGAIAPGYDADFLLLDDLEKIDIYQVYKSGELVAEKGKMVQQELKESELLPHLTNSMQFKDIDSNDLSIHLENSLAHVIGIIPNSLITKHLIKEVDVEKSCFLPSVKRDLLKLVVIERHKKTGNIGLGIVHGLNLQSGVIASTVAHDSHNLVIAGTNDTDILTTIDEIKKMSGGLVVVENGEVLASLSLPIAGLMTDQGFTTVNRELNDLNEALRQIGFSGNFNPFLTLSFLALPVIPELKLTDLGLFDVNNFQHISISSS